MGGTQGGYVWGGGRGHRHPGVNAVRHEVNGTRRTDKTEKECSGKSSRARVAVTALVGKLSSCQNVKRPEQLFRGFFSPSSRDEYKNYHAEDFISIFLVRLERKESILA